MDDDEIVTLWEIYEHVNQARWLLHEVDFEGKSGMGNRMKRITNQIKDVIKDKQQMEE